MAPQIPSQQNVLADKLSSLGRIIKTEWFLLPEVLQLICTRWHQHQIDIFATRFKNKLPHFVSPVPDSLACVVDALSLSWEDLDLYVLPTIAILGKVVVKLRHFPCWRVIMVIIIMVVQHALVLGFGSCVKPNPTVPAQLALPLTQKFNQIPHNNLSKLNLYTWLREPQLSRSKASVRHWQHDLKAQPDQPMKQS